jgi:uncharacterized protein YggL (DUF469 family)
MMPPHSIPLLPDRSIAYETALPLGLESVTMQTLITHPSSHSCNRNHHLRKKSHKNTFKILGLSFSNGFRRNWEISQRCEMTTRLSIKKQNLAQTRSFLNENTLLCVHSGNECHKVLRKPARFWDFTALSHSLTEEKIGSLYNT